MFCVSVFLLLVTGISGFQKESEEWIRFGLRARPKGRILLEATHQGWQGRTLEVHAVQNGETVESRYMIPKRDGTGKAEMRVDAQLGEIRFQVVEKRTEQLVLDAPMTQREAHWLYCGPFPVTGTGFGQKLPPESGKLDYQAEYKTANGSVGWRALDPALLANNRFLDFTSLIGPLDHVVVYVATVWKFPDRTKAVLKLGSDDMIEVFLNGKRIHANDVKRGSSAAQDTVAVTFKKGDNTLLIKVGDHGGGWGMHFRAETPEGKPLTGYETRPYRTPDWRPGGPPRITFVAAGRVVFEYGSPTPVPAKARYRLGKLTPPDPREWLHRKQAMVLPFEVEAHEVEGDGVLRTEHRVELLDLRPGLRFAVCGLLPASTSSEDLLQKSLAPPVQTTAWSVFATPPAPQKTLVHHLRVAVIFFGDVVERGRGHDREVPRELIEQRIEDAQRDFEEARQFFFAHSGARLSLDLQSFVDWKKHVIPTGTAHGMYSRPKIWEEVERVLYDARKRPAEFDAYALISCDRYWDGANSRWVLPASGGSTHGALAPYGSPRCGWKIGCPNNAWMLAHEFHHALDGMFMDTGAPEYLNNHYYQWDGTAHAHGEHWDGMRFIMREWGGRISKQQPFEWQDRGLGWRYFGNAWGYVKSYDDSDEDGLPDRAPDLPNDEERFGSLTQEPDSDDDGLNDLEEYMRSAWLVYGQNEVRLGNAPRLMQPRNPDSDGDGLNDAIDPHPLWNVPSDLGTPNVFKVDDERFGPIELQFQWREGALHIKVLTERPLERASIMIDADNDGWFVGADNFWVDFGPGGIFARDFVQCAEPNKRPFNQPERVPDSMFGFSGSPRDGWDLVIFPHAAAGFEGTPGEQLGILFKVDMGPDEPYRDGRAGFLTMFEPHAFFRTRLPQESDAAGGRD